MEGIVKTCSKCGESKPMGDYYKHIGSPDGHRGDCKMCVLISRRERYETDGAVLRDRVRLYQQQNPEKIHAYRQTDRAKTARRGRDRRDYLLRNYGITPAKFDQMFAEQGGRCAVCGSDDPVRRWIVDHDHVTGVVRGILCWNCNFGLGHFRDDIHTIVAAAAYLIADLAKQKAGDLHDCPQVTSAGSDQR